MLVYQRFLRTLWVVAIPMAALTVACASEPQWQTHTLQVKSVASGQAEATYEEIPPSVYADETEYYDDASAPPEPREEYVPEPEDEGQVWIAGYWSYNGDDYEWQPGHYVAGRAGEYWRPPAFLNGRWYPGRWLKGVLPRWHYLFRLKPGFWYGGRNYRARRRGRHGFARGRRRRPRDHSGAGVTGSSGTGRQLKPSTTLRGNRVRRYTPRRPWVYRGVKRYSPRLRYMPRNPGGPGVTRRPGRSAPRYSPGSRRRSTTPRYRGRTRSYRYAPIRRPSRNSSRGRSGSRSRSRSRSSSGSSSRSRSSSSSRSRSRSSSSSSRSSRRR